MKRFCSARSIWKRPGARMMLRPALPQVPRAGHGERGGVEPLIGGLVGWIEVGAGTTIGALARIVAVGQVPVAAARANRQAAGRSAPAADRTAAIRRRSWRTAPPPLPSRPNGSAYTPFIVSVCRTSWLVEAVLAGAARGILRRRRFAAAERALVERVRPHVLRAELQTRSLRGGAARTAGR